MKKSLIILLMLLTTAAFTQTKKIASDGNNLRTGPVVDGGTGLCTMNDIYDFVMANAGTGTVTEVTSATTNQLTVADGTTTPALSIVTGPVADAGTGLCTMNDIYDFVIANAGTSFWVQSGDTLSPATPSDNIQLESTTTSSNGVIFKDDIPFIHDFHHPTGSTQVPSGHNVFIGNAGNFTMGSTATSTSHASDNISIGYESFINNTIGFNNIGMGTFALRNNTEGSANIAFGSGALRFNTTGLANSAFGVYSLFSNTTGYGNTGVGHNSLLYITTGTENVGIGYLSGRYYSSGTSQNETPVKSIYIGYDARASAASQTNEIVIGSGTIANGSNTVTLGDDNVTDVYMAEDSSATVHAGSIQITVQTTDVSNPPTDAELDSAFGTPASVGAGWTTYINDNGGGTNFYKIVSDGTNWWIFTGTKAL